ncbi:MAG: hypothetical protein Q4B80_02800 [Aerococcaceae bacterium]|nr:hypothetical protein [Aerococcaceae bacterium]
MLSEKNKATRIMKEIISYFLDNGLNDFDLKFQINDNEFYLFITADTEKEPASFAKLLSDLQTERQIEIDEYYNALLGSHCHQHDYSFLGKAIDKSEGSFENGKLSLAIWRYHVL